MFGLYTLAALASTPPPPTPYDLRQVVWLLVDNYVTTYDDKLGGYHSAWGPQPMERMMELLATFGAIDERDD